MKKLTLLLSFILIVTCSLQAQKQFAGEVQFKLKIEGTDDPNLISQIEDVPIKTYVLGNKAKLVTDQGMALVNVITDGDKGTMTLIIEAMGMGKLYKKMDINKNKEYSFQYEDEYKTICDYKCQKVIVTETDLEDDSTSETILYVTKQIGGPKINSVQTPGLEGFALLSLQPMPQFCDECMMATEAIKVTPKKLKDVDFMLPADAKNIDDDPELKEMLGF